VDKQSCETQRNRNSCWIVISGREMKFALGNEMKKPFTWRVYERWTKLHSVFESKEWAIWFDYPPHFVMRRSEFGRAIRDFWFFWKQRIIWETTQTKAQYSVCRWTMLLTCPLPLPPLPILCDAKGNRRFYFSPQLASTSSPFTPLTWGEGRGGGGVTYQRCVASFGVVWCFAISW